MQLDGVVKDLVLYTFNIYYIGLDIYRSLTSVLGDITVHDFITAGSGALPRVVHT